VQIPEYVAIEYVHAVAMCRYVDRQASEIYDIDIQSVLASRRSLDGVNPVCAVWWSKIL